jgi:hypothetical protein
LNRLQLQTQQLQEQQRHASSQKQHATQAQSCTTLAQASTILESEAKHSIGSSAVLLILQAGALQSCDRSVYATSVSVASVQQSRASLHAVATVANLVHELAAVRKSRVAALAFVHLYSSGSCVNLGADEDGALDRNVAACRYCVSLPLQLSFFTVILQAALNTEVLLGKLGQIGANLAFG